MRLHRLSVQALQAFAGREEVDFDALGAGGLFLLHGDTGAGKTTLLDAVCFALYGKLPGARAAQARERSDHAEAGLRTEVVLEATLRGERVRVTRTPKQLRPKRRGEGTVEEAATVRLERFDADGVWQTLATRHDEAAMELDRLLGMSREQFCQVVLLPQGEFATFLRAGSDERWEVLERLFATERFSAAEDWLTRLRKATDAELGERRAALRDVAAKVTQAVGCELPAGWEVEPAALAPWLSARLGEAEAAVVAADAACAAVGAERDAAQERVRAATELSVAQARHAEAVAELKSFEAARGIRDAGAEELAAARRAATVAPGLRDAEAQDEAAAGREAVAARAVDGLRAVDPVLAAEAGDAEPSAQTTAQLDLLDAGPDAALLRERAAALRVRAGEAGALAEVEAALAARAAQTTDAVARIAEHERVLAGADAALADAPARELALARRLEQARAGRASLADRVREARQAQDRLAAARAREHLAGVIAGLGDGHRASVGAEQAARETWLDLRQRRLEGMAGELAQALTDGDACPVCGAVEHPAPAHAAAGATVDAEAEDAARLAHETTRAALDAAEQRLAEARRRQAAAVAVAGGESMSVLAAQATAAETLRDRARLADADVEPAGGALDAFAAERQALTARRAAATEAVAALHATLAAWASARDADETRLASALAGAPRVADRVAALEAAAAGRDAAAEAVGAAATARAAAGAAAARATAAVRAAGFADLPGAWAAVRDVTQMEALEARVRRYDAGVAQRSATAGDPELVAASAQPAPDLDALRARVRAAAEAQARAEREHEVADRSTHALRALDRELAATLATLAPVADRAREVRELAFLVDGSAAANHKRMRLSAYVLAARLEEIAAAASVRLAAMSAGRYALEHSDLGARGRSRGGLDLRVVDGWTGRDRHPATLSGGETFLASLALALGLADVVAAEAGGARLETLFVDEGFGSLDETTLDEVLDVLDRLRSGGRAVGIVSHVAELRQRVGAQLHVVKGRGGSSVRQAVAA